MQLTDEQYARLEWLARRQAHTLTEAEDAAAIAAALVDLDARAAEIERLRAEATALRSEVAALGARIRRHEARARAWEYPEGEG
jgi:polyhydroxyalkanoate synthesis regulator phasin